MDLANFLQDTDPLGIVEPIEETIVPPVKPYRANRKKFFLTYSRCEKSMEEVYAHLGKISEIHKYLIARELHKDGTPHIHAYIEFVNKQDFKNSRWADFDDHHPNDAGSIRNELAVTKYCTKDNNFISNFYKLDPWKLIYDDERSYSDSIKLIREDRPRDYTLYSDQIERTLKKVKFNSSTKARYDSTTFKGPTLDLSRAVLLYGPGGIGKTQYALSHFKTPLLVTHIDDLKKITPETDGLVFDDMSFKHLPSDTIIYLLDMECTRSIHARNTNAVIPEGLKRIFTHNERDIFEPEKITFTRQEAINRRLNFVFVSEQLF